jgi:hypothetical protein
VPVLPRLFLWQAGILLELKWENGGHPPPPPPTRGIPLVPVHTGKQYTIYSTFKKAAAVLIHSFPLFKGSAHQDGQFVIIERDLEIVSVAHVRALSRLPTPTLFINWQFGTQLAKKTSALSSTCDFSFASCEDWNNWEPIPIGAVNALKRTRHFSPSYDLAPPPPLSPLFRH